MLWLLAVVQARTSGLIGQRSFTIRRRLMALTRSGGEEVPILALLTWKFGGARSKEQRNSRIPPAQVNLLG